MMKCQELLSEESIQDLIHKIDNYRIKVIEKPSRASENIFLNSCQALFEKSKNKFCILSFINLI